jgi:protein O-mannosyl-transferase
MFKEISVKTIEDIWSKPYWNMYIPLTYTFWMLVSIASKAISGGFNPWLFHLANISVHAMNAALVFMILLKLNSTEADDRTKTSTAAFIAALLFGLHPIHVEPVAWISGMKDVLCGFMSLMSLNLYFSTSDEKKSFFLDRNYIMAFIFFILACLSKPNAITVPFIAFILDQTFTGKPASKSAAQLAPWLAVCVAFAISTKVLMPEPVKTGFVSLMLRPFIAVDTTFFYFKKIIWPDVFYHDYGRKIGYLTQYLLNCLLPVLYAGFFCIICIIKNRKIWIWLFMIFLVCIAPNSGLVPFVFQEISTVADRYAYMAVFPFSIAVYLLLKNADKKILAMASVFIFFLFVKSSAQCLVWQDNFSLNNYTLRYNDKSYAANVNLGLAFAGKGRFADAVEYYKKCLEIDPSNDLAYYDLGIAYACTGKNNLAAEQVQKLKIIGESEKASSLENVINKIRPMIDAETQQKDSRNPSTEIIYNGE